jgi:hypothetical protein
MQNKMISQLHYEIIQCKNQIIDKFGLMSKGWSNKFSLKNLFDKNKMTKQMRQIEKTQSTQEIEKNIQNYQLARSYLSTFPNEQQNYLVLIDYSEVK